jgi:mono/diheme cytochrome c family protein
MPAWSVDYGGPLTDEDIRSTVTFIKSWEATAPILEPMTFVATAEEGALIFDTNCAVCHGANGAGTGFAPTVNDPSKIDMTDDQWLRDLLRFGLPAKGMPSYGSILSEEQTDHLVALFEAWDEGKNVIPTHSATDLINAAIFSLENDDHESAMLHIDRALTIMADGPGKEMMNSAKSQLEAGDLSGALETLLSLQEQWPIGDPANGAMLYETNCAVCHGDNGQGGGDGVFPALNPNQYVQENTNAELVKFIQEGREGTAMAAFEGRLNEDEIADIVAHLRTWQP